MNAAHIRLEVTRLMEEDRIPYDVLAQLIAEYSDRKEAPEQRRARYNALVEHFGIEPWAHDDGTGSPPDRYAAVYGIADFEDPHICTLSTVDDAFYHLGVQVLEGAAPDGVYDLDTGQKIDIHVSTPIITASEDQGVTHNPLDPLVSNA